MFNDNPQPPIDPPWIDGGHSDYKDSDFVDYKITINVTMNVAECDVEQFVESLLKDLVNEVEFGDQLHSLNIEEVS